jgi:glycosyltransferase involved in cell wall biosynthesis
MRIAIDARMITEKPHGIAQYALNLVSELTKIGTAHTYFLLTAKDAPITRFAFPHTEVIPCSIPLYSIQEQVALLRLLKKLSIDIFHSPTYAAPVYLPQPFCLTIHDLIHLIFKQDYTWKHQWYYRLIVKKAAQKAARIFTVSEHTKKDIMHYLGIAESKIVVIPHGIRLDFHPMEKNDVAVVINKYGLNGSVPFILAVGNPKPHKNLNRVIEAFQQFIQQYNEPINLVIIGLQRKNTARIKFLEYCPAHDMPAIYNSARALIFPSLYEGFGLPPLEAMACGTPVMVSNQASLPEICGDAAYYVEPDVRENIVQGFHNLLTDTALRQRLIKNGRERTKLFSWERTAKETLKEYEDIVYQKHSV